MARINRGLVIGSEQESLIKRKKSGRFQLKASQLKFKTSLQIKLKHQCSEAK